MIYDKLYKFADKKKVIAGLIGSGHYGTAVVTQSFFNPYLKIPIIADYNIDNAKKAYHFAGINNEDIVICDNRKDTLLAIEQGKYVVVQDSDILFECHLDVVLESTGNPEAGAQNAYKAIKSGKHVAMINKETDSVVGPVLKHLANKEGLIYTPVDGDQHGLLMGLISWAKGIGLNVISGGKSRDIEFIYNDIENTVKCKADGIALQESYRVNISDDNQRFFNYIQKGKVEEYVKQRHALLQEIPKAQPFDLCEMTIVANATGMPVDTPELHNPVARITEIPQILSTKEDDGILEKEALEVVTCLREEYTPGLGGGVFIVVSSDNDYSRKILVDKGLISNSQGSTALIYRPYHLCGVETSTSVLCAGMLGLSTGIDDYISRYDMVRITEKNKKAGDVIGDDHDPDYRAAIIPASKITEGGAVPAHMLNDRKLVRDVPKDTVISFDMVDIPKNTSLWRLREKQDNLFL